jgi:hypothetical protein
VRLCAFFWESKPGFVKFFVHTLRIPKIKKPILRCGVQSMGRRFRQIGMAATVHRSHGLRGSVSHSAHAGARRISRAGWRSNAAESTGMVNDILRLAGLEEVAPSPTLASVAAGIICWRKHTAQIQGAMGKLGKLGR